MKQLKRFLGPLLAIVLFSVAFFVLRNELHRYSYHEIVDAIQSIPRQGLLYALAFTILNYLVLSFYEVLGFRYIHRSLPWPRIATTSFVAYAFSNNVGFYSLSGSAVRLRLYSLWGLSTLDISRLITFSSFITFWLGLCAICSLVFSFSPVSSFAVLHISSLAVRTIGLAFLLPIIAFILLTIFRRRPIQIRDWELEVPSVPLSLGLILTACADWLLFACVMYSVLPAGNVSFMMFLGVFFAAQLVGLISHVPGGIGVFESVMLLLLPPSVASGSTLMGSLLVFRAVYYLLPLIMAAVLLGIIELRQRKKIIAGVATTAIRWSGAVVPQILAILTFAAGIVLLFSGATPAEHNRLLILDSLVPLALIEAGHFLGSIVGILLVILSWGIYRRFDSAYHLTVVMLVCGMVLSLLKGLDWEEALVLAVLLAALLPNRSHFYRTSSLVNEPWTPGWIVAVIATIAGTLWLGFFAHKHVDYSNELWWQFGLHDNAARFLRAQVGISVATLAFAFVKLLSPARIHSITPVGATDMDNIRSIVATSGSSNACLAMLDDKRFIISDAHDAFIMYGVQGRSIIAMGDPVGNPASFPALVWELKDICDRHGATPVFYEVSKTYLHLYLDIGLTLLKLGEEARVDLSTFNMNGSEHKGLRYAVRKLEQEGWTFDVILPQDVGPVLGRLREISDHWLATKNTREKRFSIGRFNEPYLQQTPVAVLRRNNTISAFSNIWITGTHNEASIDLMRHDDSAPRGAMDGMFVNLLLWAQKQGYRWFNLGMAPFSGIESRSAAPLWNKMGSLLFLNGEYFYNFQGLRQYKEKFGPIWEPCYLASPGAFSLPAVLRDVSAIVSGGIKGLFAK